MRHVVLLLFAALALAACDDTAPIPQNITALCQYPRPSGSCEDPGWCRAQGECGLLYACECANGQWRCYDADLCDLGEGASCELEGNSSCNVSPVGGSCTCTDGEVVCEKNCPLPECPDYDAVLEQCTCASASCM